MEKILWIVSGSLMLWAPFVTYGAEAASTKVAAKKDVSIYEVTWRCPAALQIGCGSHAKPVLLELEKTPGVSEAWLNRQGTAVAVVWSPDAKRKAKSQAEKMLKEQNAEKLSGKNGAKLVGDFESGKGWYRGAEVDRLSEEEAGIIAARWVRRLQSKTTLTTEKSEALQSALTDGLKKYLKGEREIPETEEAKTLGIRRVASPFLDEKQSQLLVEAAGEGMCAIPGEK